MSKVKLTFSVGYDSLVYIKDKNLFNHKFVGELQLLAYLERELGLTGEFLSEKERQAEYLGFLMEEQSNDNFVFIATSFEKDKIGVANELLLWRDQLKMCDWDFKKSISERLDLLSDIEKKYTVPFGISDRWLRVLVDFKNVDELNIESVDLRDDPELLHPILSNVFDLLEHKGVRVDANLFEMSHDISTNLMKVKDVLINNTSKVRLDASDNSFQIVRFKDSIIAADFLAQQIELGLSSNTVVINRNNYGLDTSLLSYNLPLSGAKVTEANPQQIQLFKLLPALLFKKVNPYNLLSLFDLPMLPFSKSLAYRLKKVLIENAGLGNEDWFSAITEVRNQIEKEGSQNKKGKLKKIELYINRERKDKVSSGDLLDIYSDIQTWASQSLNYVNSEVMKMQLTKLQSLSNVFIQSLNSLNKVEFTEQELTVLISKIYDPITFSANAKERGSVDVYDKSAAIYDKVEHLVWFDFYNTEIKADFGAFLMQKEKENLFKSEGFFFWHEYKQVELKFQLLKNAILKTDNRLTLFIVDKSVGESTKEHPLYTQLRSAISNIKEFEHNFDLNDFSLDGWGASKVKQIAKNTLPEQKAYIEINKAHASLLKKRDLESYSSIEKLIQDPIDWVMKYQAKLDEKGFGEIGDLRILKGNLSHIVVQTLLQKDKEGNINLFEMDIDLEIDNQLEIYTPQIASPFYLDENTFEFTKFRNQLKKSFKGLLTIIKDNNLKFDSFEKEIINTIGGVKFSGSIDLLFRKDNVPVVIDLKWTAKSKTYREKIKEGKALQLALYSKLFIDSSVISAYYLLSDAIMFTNSSSLKGDAVIKVDPKYDEDTIIRKALNSYKYRWKKEFKNGVLESAEGVSINEIKYVIKIEDLYPLNLDSKKKVKAENYYSKFRLFKGLVK